MDCHVSAVDNNKKKKSSLKCFNSLANDSALFAFTCHGHVISNLCLTLDPKPSVGSAKSEVYFIYSCDLLREYLSKIHSKTCARFQQRNVITAI